MRLPIDPPSSFRPLNTEQFHELTLIVEGDTAQVRHERSDTIWQRFSLAAGVGAFVVFIVAVMPLMHLSRGGNALWVLIGVVALFGVGLSTHALMKVTTIVFTDDGVAVEQGNFLDRESVSFGWGDLRAVELEPVDEKDGRRGMKLRMTLGEGDPIDSLAGVGVGELNAVRRMMLAEMNRQAGIRAKLQASRRAADAQSAAADSGDAGSN